MSPDRSVSRSDDWADEGMGTEPDTAPWVVVTFFVIVVVGTAVILAAALAGGF